MTHRKAIVVWEDIKVVDDAGWVDKPSEPYVWKAYLCTSMGFIWYDGPEGIVLTDSIAPEHIGPRTQIPRGCIREVTMDSPALDKRKRKV